MATLYWNYKQVLPYCTRRMMKGPFYILQYLEMKEGQNIKVVARLRPLNALEMQQGGECCVSYGEKQITVTVGSNDKQDFAFDRIFGPDSEQADVFDEVGRPILDSVMNGYNGTIFAYGQTSSGKTFTMEGPDNPNERTKGLIPRVMTELFDVVHSKSEELIYIVKVSFLEIYNEKIMDLLDTNKTNLKIKEDRLRGIFVQNLTEIKVESPEEMKQVMMTGSNNRTIAATRMNERSSRSHSLFQIQVSEKNLKTDSSKLSKLYFVDLAGSEKISKTNVSGQQLEEAKNINKSLTCLGMVINALTSDKKEHIPYRDSKLTRILSESLGGNAKTTLVVACSMCSYNDKETISTLRFGARAKAIKNKPTINAEKSAKELQALLDIAEQKILEQDEIINKLMEKVENGTSVSMDKGNSNSNLGPQQNAAQSKQHSSLQLLKEHKLVVNLQEELEFQKTEMAALQINYQSRIDELQEKLLKQKFNEEHTKQQLSECLKNNQKFIFENEQLKTQILENDQKLFDFRRALSSTKQDLDFFLANLNLKNQFNQCPSDSESTKDIFMTEQYDKEIEERTFQSIVNFSETLTKLDTILLKDFTQEQVITQIINPQFKKKNVSFQMDSQPPSPKSNKLLDIDNYSFQTDEDELNIKFDENEQTLIKSTQENEEISDVEKLLAMLGDKMEDSHVLLQIQEVFSKLRRQLQVEQEKVQEIYQIMVTIKDQFSMYQIKEREKMQKLKLSYNQKKSEMSQSKHSLQKQLEDLTVEFQKYKHETEKQQQFLTQINQQLIIISFLFFILQQQESSAFNPLSREYQLECTVKQLMQERNDMHNSLLQTRQQLENAIKLKNSQAEEIIKLQKKIDTIELQLQHKKLQEQDLIRRQFQRRFSRDTKKTASETQGWSFDQIIKDDHARNIARLETVLGYSCLETIQTGACVGKADLIINEFQKIYNLGSEQQGNQQEYDDLSPVIGTRTIISKEVGECKGQNPEIFEQYPSQPDQISIALDVIMSVNKHRNFTNNLSMTLERPPLEEFQESYYPE
ncbi:unnamed protein product (macronuclear) [Paramecium tetraurelia]|uniref:Kinesin motor domain-containing protein n=1 Tax=Paramecium tetraurelia TaxID=5888 RepID=A0DBA0_PARTE|nr:uncharacterized protein GSPATT00015211001 [Paramecium tetraurelia]CAK80317.1 unnamed protein product [Paramecium tetraurelia]|eukprot:XP_001447714.1 hypothetical protein (macronuclear) [Paramecium tetraurelia strain d4-2]